MQIAHAETTTALLPQIAPSEFHNRLRHYLSTITGDDYSPHNLGGVGQDALTTRLFLPCADGRLMQATIDTYASDFINCPETQSSATNSVDRHRQLLTHEHNCAALQCTFSTLNLASTRQPGEGFRLIFLRPELLTVSIGGIALQKIFGNTAQTSAQPQHDVIARIVAHTEPSRSYSLSESLTNVSHQGPISVLYALVGRTP